MVPRVFSSLNKKDERALFVCKERKAEVGDKMQVVGFILFCIGIMIAFGAKRIVLSKTKLEEKDKEEIELLMGGAVIAVKLAGFVVAVIGMLFLMI